MTTRDRAISLASKGYHVFPVRVAVGPNGDNTKAYPTRWVKGPPGEVATTDLDVIHGWWGDDSPLADCMIGIATGPSGIVVIDLDIKHGHDGPAHWAELVPQFYPLPAAVATSSTGGRHLFYRADPRRPIKTGSGDVGDGIDTRGIGGMVVAWGTWLPKPSELPAVPDVVHERANRPDRLDRPEPLTPPMGSGQTDHPIDGETLFVHPAAADPRGWLLSFPGCQLEGCRRVLEVRDRALRSLATRSHRHADLVAGTATLVRMLPEGHRGVWPALEAVRDGFAAATAGENRGDEWGRALVGAIGLADTLPRVNRDPCDDPASFDPLDTRTGRLPPTESTGHPGTQQSAGWQPANWQPDMPNTPSGPLASANGADPTAVDLRAQQIEYAAYLEEIKLRARQLAQQRVTAEHRLDAPPSIDLTALLDEPDEPVTFRIMGLMPEGARVVLAAQRKTGKTTMVTNLVRCLADGGLFLDRYQVHPPVGRIATLDFEMVRQQYRWLLRQQQIVATKKVEVHSLRGYASSFDILDPAIRSAWARTLHEQEIETLIVDCLRPILDSIGLDENKDAGRFLAFLDALLAEAGIPECILVHHAGHTGERSRGDSRIRDWPDVEWRIVRERPDREGEEPSADGLRFFAAEGRGDVAVPESTLLFDRQGHRLSLEPGNRGQAKAAKDHERILREAVMMLRDAGGPLRQLELEQGITGRAETIRQVLEAGRIKGLLIMTKGIKNSKLWNLPNRGGPDD